MISKPHPQSAANNKKVLQLQPSLSDALSRKEVPINYWVETLEFWQLEINFWQKEFAALSNLYDSCSHLVTATNDSLERSYLELKILVSEKLKPIKAQLQEIQEKLNQTSLPKRATIREAAQLRQHLETVQTLYKKQKIQFLEALYEVIPLSFF